MRHLPHLVIDGALVAAARARQRPRRLRARRARSRRRAQSVEQALAERDELHRSRGAPAVQVAAVPRGYLTGQETALVNVLDGGPPQKPTVTPPYPFERGLRGRPTLVSNAETLAQLALIARHGAEWFRTLGTDGRSWHQAGDSWRCRELPGRGRDRRRHDRRPVDQSLRRARGADPGSAARRLRRHVAGTRRDRPAARRADAARAAGRRASAAGIVFAAPGIGLRRRRGGGRHALAAARERRAVRPVYPRAAAIADALEELCAEGDRHGAYGRIERWCGLVMRRGACALPDGAASFVTSALHTFRPEFDDHARHGACDACVGQRILPTTSLDAAYAA